jgi:hypothetical protein
MRKIILILAGSLILTQGRLPNPVAAALEFAPGVGADADQPVIKELVAAFDEAEAVVKKADLDALMKFYPTTYNYHGLKRSDMRRVWDEVFLHYRDISSSHVFTELKLVQVDGVRKAYVTCTGGLYGTEKQTGKPIILFSNRMLKKSASFVLASLRGSTLRKSFSEVRSTRGDFPFAKIYSQGERSTRSVVYTSSPLRSLRPCWTNFLSILLVYSCYPRCAGQ